MTRLKAKKAQAKAKKSASKLPPKTSKKAPKKPKKAPKKGATTLGALSKLAQKQVLDILDSAQSFPGLRKKGPRSVEWKTGVQLVGSAEMGRLNLEYRGKKGATDILSFSAAEPFVSLGYLGELVIAVPVLKLQAREQKHRPEDELAVLLTHGVLHLLGFDHERGAKQAKEMAEWELRLLAMNSSYRGKASLIERTQ